VDASVGVHAGEIVEVVVEVIGLAAADKLA
jgi:hypothetical protein